MCGQRVSDFIASLKSEILEWIIIFTPARRGIVMVADLLQRSWRRGQKDVLNSRTETK